MKTLLTLLTLSLTLSSFAQASVLKCDGIGSDKGASLTFELVGANKVKVNDVLADLDEAYSPRLNHNLYRFVYEYSDEGFAEVLVQEQLLDGSEKGLIKVQVRGEGFETQSYYCHP